MSYLSHKVLIGTAILLLGAEVAEAQMGGAGGPMGGGMGGPQQPAGEEKKEGVAEAAPKAPGLLPTTPALPPPKGRRKRWKLLELDGYYRLRTDWWKNFNLGFVDNPALGGASFPRALGCSSTAVGHPCDNSLAGTNMRLRLEPTLNIDEGTSVHIQADVFDNLLLGSTWNGLDFQQTALSSTANPPPSGAFSNTQDAPQAGVNQDRDAIRFKRAWAEVAVPLGILKFGRQPNHWGMGMLFNSGAYNPFDGTYDYDADYGDSVDRVSFSAVIPGTSLRAMIASDWDISALVSNQTNQNPVNPGHPFNLDNDDDMNSWVGVISKLDSPQEFHDTVERGDLALNYGVYFEYKRQGWSDNLTGFQLGTEFDSAANYVRRDLTLYTPDVWGKLGYGPITLEGEFAAQFGNIKNLEDYGFTNESKVRKFGGVARLTWKGVENKLRLGLEGGFATGDQWDNNPQGRTQIVFSQPLGDPAVCNAEHGCTLTQFFFNREYKVDMILWRYLYGAVTNAAYGKPFLSYDLTKSISFKVSNITSAALKTVATPGNGRWYGTEFDGELAYQGHRFYAGIAYGVLFPFSALSHPITDPNSGGPGFPYGGPNDPNGNNTGSATTAHNINARLVLQF